MIRISATLLALPLLVAGCAGTAEEPARTAKAETRLDQLLAGKTPVATRSCIPLRSADRQTIIDERTIIYEVGASLVYRNELPGCPGLDDRSTLIHRTTSSSLCSGEIFHYRDAGTGFDEGSCTFGPFTEFRSSR